MRYILLTIAAVSCIYGTVNGEAEAVLRKAVAVCMECCGIG
ncbi:MAG: thioredoxin [Lachnospiraceae bacterium]|nr:thioredoxin [Lachnospiraceae bacterium]